MSPMEDIAALKENVDAVRKGHLNRDPIVSVIERAQTDEFRLEWPILRANTSKPLPRNPQATSWFPRIRRPHSWPHFTGPARSTAPAEKNILAHVLMFLVFVGLLSLVSRFPIRGALIAFVCISGFGFILLLGTIVLDLTIHSKSIHQMRRFIESQVVQGLVLTQGILAILLLLF